jgi:activator of HSP90 ATPase
MEKTLKAYFNGFSLVRSSVMNSSSMLTLPLIIERMKNNGQDIGGGQNKNTLARGAFKARASIASFNYQKQFSTSKDNILLNNSGGSASLLDKENLSDDMNSFDEYLKYSYDQTTNEIIGSSLKAKRLSLASSSDTYKYRSQSFGLLSLNNEGQFSLFCDISFFFFIQASLFCQYLVNRERSELVRDGCQHLANVAVKISD